MNTIIWEVRQRSPHDVNSSRELGNFTDETMAKQVIDWCYREAYSAMMSNTFTPTFWLSQAQKELAQQNGSDMWRVDDIHSTFPLFYTVPHRLFNAVPTWDNNFIFSQSDEPFTMFTPVTQEV